MKKFQIDDLSENPYVGKLLVSTPMLQSGYFDRTLIYLCSSNNNGYLGLIINKPASLYLSDILHKSEAINKDIWKKFSQTSLKIPFLHGGPVDNKSYFTLHTAESKFNSTVMISEDIALTSDLDIYQAIDSGWGPQYFLNLSGYTAWYAGQLEQEIKAGYWLIQEPCPSLLFSINHEEKYDKVLLDIGINKMHFTMKHGYA